MEVSAGTNNHEKRQLPEKRDRVRFHVEAPSKPRRWVKRARPNVDALPPPAPIVAPLRPQVGTRATTIEELIPTDSHELFTPINLYRFLKHSRDSITRRVIAQEKNRAETRGPTGQSEDSIRKILHDEMLKLSFPKADKNIRMFFRGGFAIDKIGDMKATVSLHLYQRGFSLGSDMNNWHEYDRHSAQFLNAIDNGTLPPFISELLRNAKWVFYDGFVVMEIVDYRSMTQASHSPSVHRCLLKPTAETVVGDIERLCDLKVLTKVEDEQMDDLKIALEERILRVNSPKVCLEPTIRVLQVASVLSYNINQYNVPSMNRKQMALCMKSPQFRQKIIEEGIPPVRAPSTMARDWTNISDVPGASPMQNHTRTLLRCANYVHHSQNGLSNHAKNILLNDTISRQTIFNPTPTLPDAQNGTPRLTIQSKVKIHAPGARPVKVSIPKPGDVRSLRFFAQRNMRQMHDLFIFSRPCRLGVPEPPVSSGTFEGILKITSEGEKKPDILRFNIGNHETTNKFVSAYITQSQREGRVMLHDKDPTGTCPPPQPKFLVYPQPEAQQSSSWPTPQVPPVTIKQENVAPKPPSHVLPTPQPSTPLPPSAVTSASVDGRYPGGWGTAAASKQMQQALKQARFQLQASSTISASAGPSSSPSGLGQIPGPRRSATPKTTARQAPLNQNPSGQ